MEMYAKMTGEREQVRLFHDRASALEWLGLENLPRPLPSSVIDFTLWKDADTDIPILKQAKAEYRKLQ
jgi:hypothetical protein